jgi:hypothetical protein
MRYCSLPDSYGVNILVGPSGSEQYLIPNIFIGARNRMMASPNYMMFVPAGTRLSVQASDVNGATNTLNVALLGIFK